MVLLRITTVLIGMSVTVQGMAKPVPINYLGQKHILIKSKQLQLKTKYFPLLIESNIQGRQVSGSVYALLKYPAEQIKDKLRHIHNWCFIVHLHPNIKACVKGEADNSVQVFVGSKLSSKAMKSQRFLYQTGPAAGRYFAMALTAASGPYQTRDYYIILEAVAFTRNSTVLRLGYGYQYGRQTGVMQQIYFRTLGRNKVGFSTWRDDKGKTSPVKGLRGAVERNSMRYFLGLRAFFETEKGIEQTYAYWFDLTSRYPQLYELPRNQYLINKQNERQYQAGLVKILGTSGSQ